MWSSGSGAAGIISSFSYAALTEPHFANFSPKATLLVMLIIPFLYAATFWLIMDVPDSVYQVNVFDPRSYIIKPKNKLKSSVDPIMSIATASDAVNPLEDYEIQDLNNSTEQKKLNVKDKVKLFWVNFLFNI
uniref:Uncharacterized protein n=1 Tax=Panagrolaimus sp. ES5 TaxID=591445 RepID=A0AC34FM24_9BILA